MSCGVTSLSGSRLCQGEFPCGAAPCVLGGLAEAERGHTSPRLSVEFLEGILLIPCLCPAMEQGGPAQVSAEFSVN